MKDDEKAIEGMLENLDPDTISKQDYQHLLTIKETVRKLILGSTSPEELEKWQEKHGMISRILDKIKTE